MKTHNIILVFVLMTALLPNKLFAQVLETEESKPLPPGHFEVGTGLEFQTSSQGTESALPLAIEYGLSNKFTLLVEPVGFTNIHPNTGSGATGIGDLEVTLFYQIVSEKKVLPSISVSGEVKIPTAHNKLIGTGKTDYTPFLIMSKTTGRFFTSINLSYSFIGKPKGVKVNNLFNYGIGTKFTASPRSILFAELYGNTAALSGGEAPENTSQNINTTEFTGGETVGAFGYGYYLEKGLLLSIGLSYDNNNAVLFRPGIEWKF